MTTISTINTIGPISSAGRNGRGPVRVVVAAAALAAALVITGCTPPAPRTVVPGDHRAGRAPTETGVAYGPRPEHVADVHRSSAPRSRGTIVFLHGGGFTSGSRSVLTAGTFGLLLAQLDRGFDLVTVDYRLAPADGFPAAFHDAALAVDWVRSDGAAHGIDTGRVIVAGHSAGGSLAAMVGTSPDAPTEFGRVPRVDGWISIAGMAWYDGGGYLRDFPGDWGLRSSAQRRAASPLTTLDAGDPPGYLVHGDRDGFIADWHSVMLAAHADSIGARVDLDHVTTGPDRCRRHFPMCGADAPPFESFLG